jgi:hypothetical protein
MVLREAGARHASPFGRAQAFGILRTRQRHAMWIWRVIPADIYRDKERSRRHRCVPHC